MKILHGVAEFYGLAKTGGLADMVAALSSTLNHRGIDSRVCLPAYPGTAAALAHPRRMGQLVIHNHHFDIIQGDLSATGQKIILLDCPPLYDRAGDPYRDAAGEEFIDNGQRFGYFCKALALMTAQGMAGWHPQLAHLHDWHTALTPALLTHANSAVPSVFTIHNFSFHGLFDRPLFDELALPPPWWHPEELEFYHRFSFMKAALRYADAITTVSPRYAEEIRTSSLGCGLEGVVNRNADRLQGILNGIDDEEWNPATDAKLERTYDATSVTEGKQTNKTAAQTMLGLTTADVPMVLFIGRLAEQKGADLIVAAREIIDRLDLQLVVLASGDSHLERVFRRWAAERPTRVACVIGVNETLAHLLTAAADIQLMPSRFEPCGLSQMYAQRYGTLPVAHATGGLVDTITDANPATLSEQTATGFLFDNADVESLVTGLNRALRIAAQPGALAGMRQSAMAHNFSWKTSAERYIALYRKLIHN